MTAKAPSRVSSIKLLAGKLLSVFEKGERRLTTATAVAGIRGTGIYLESEEERSYLCLCYGKAKLSPINAPQLQENVITRHHESPRWVYPDRMEAAALINHSDDELILLESLTGRVPPFYRASGLRRWHPQRFGEETLLIPAYRVVVRPQPSIS
jgi:hypothetical protein